MVSLRFRLVCMNYSLVKFEFDILAPAQDDFFFIDHWPVQEFVDPDYACSSSY